MMGPKEKIFVAEEFFKCWELGERVKEAKALIVQSMSN